MEQQEFEVFHGTSLDAYASISQDNFKLSEGVEHEAWLGDGVYFFTNGVPPKPEILAKKWAIAEAWDKSRKCYKYTEYCIIKALVTVDKSLFLDLSSHDGLVVFNYLREKYIEKLREEHKKLKNGEFKDGHIINLAVKESFIKVKVVKGNFYIKFAEERIHNAQFRTPNCTIVAVRNVDCINKESITLHDKNTIR